MLEPPDNDGWFLGSVHDTSDGPVCYWFRNTHKGLTPPQGVVVEPRQSGKSEFPPIPAFLNTSREGNTMQTMHKKHMCRWLLPDLPGLALCVPVPNTLAATIEGFRCSPNP